MLADELAQRPAHGLVLGGPDAAALQVASQLLGSFPIGNLQSSSREGLELG